MPDDVHLIKEVQALRARRLLRTLAVVQDLSDALMAVNDVTGDLCATCNRVMSDWPHNRHQCRQCVALLCCGHAVQNIIEYEHKALDLAIAAG